MVTIYKITAFVKNENIPNVAIFNGRVRIVKIGFAIKETIANANPARINVSTPPIILNPAMHWVSKKRARLFCRVFLSNPTIIC